MKGKIVSMIAIIVSLISIASGVYIMNKNTTTIKQGKIENSQENSEKKTAIEIILENNDLKEEDLDFVEKTKENKYKFLNKKESKNKVKYYFLVDIQNKTYEVENQISMGNQPETTK